MDETELFRDNRAIDPHLHIWGWEIPVYLFLGGLVAGVMILSSLLVLRSAKAKPSRWLRRLSFAAPIAISIGMVALFLDLAYKLHVYRFFLAFKPLSPMSWGSWILLGLYPVTILFGLAVLEQGEARWLAGLRPVRWLRLGGLVLRVRDWAIARRAKLAWANVALGVGLGAYTGLLLGTLAARPAWNSVMLAPLFLASGLSSGAAFLMLFPVEGEEHRQLRRWDLGAIAVEVVLLALFLLGLAAGGGDAGLEAAKLFAGGKYTAVFWTLVVAAGLVVPFALETLESRRKLRPTLMAPALVLIGGLALRWVLVLAGQA